MSRTLLLWPQKTTVSPAPMAARAACCVNVLPSPKAKLQRWRKSWSSFARRRSAPPRTDPRTGRRKEIDRVVKAASVHEAKRAREEMLRKEERAVEPATRMRVGEYAQLWMKSKALKLDGATARTYADALEQHILPRLGELYYDVLTGRDVQAWVDDAILIGWKTKRGVKKRYSWFGEHSRAMSPSGCSAITRTSATTKSGLLSRAY
jgi:hypothetical protein